MLGGTGETVTASLRTLAVFGALATVSTVIPLLTPVAVPLWPLAFLVGVFVLRRRFSRVEQRRACLTLAVVAALVLVVEMLVAPTYVQQTFLGYAIAAEVVVAVVLGGLAYAGAQIDAIVGHFAPRRV